MRSDINKLRELAGMAAHDMTVKKYTSSLNISEFEIAATPPTILSIIDALEAANKRIAELERSNALPPAGLDDELQKAFHRIASRQNRDTEIDAIFAENIERLYES